jgi:hypothetical protein
MPDASGVIGWPFGLLSGRSLNFRRRLAFQCNNNDLYINIAG